MNKDKWNVNSAEMEKITKPVRNLQHALMAGEVSRTKKFKPIRGETYAVRRSNLMEKQVIKAEAKKTPAQKDKENAEEVRGGMQRWKGR